MKQKILIQINVQYNSNYITNIYKSCQPILGKHNGSFRTGTATTRIVKNAGFYSTGMGLSTNSSGNYSFSVGYFTSAGSTGSVTTGYSTNASGN